MVNVFLHCVFTVNVLLQYGHVGDFTFDFFCTQYVFVPTMVMSGVTWLIFFWRDDSNLDSLETVFLLSICPCSIFSWGWQWPVLSFEFSVTIFDGLLDIVLTSSYILLQLGDWTSRVPSSWLLHLLMQRYNFKPLWHIAIWSCHFPAAVSVSIISTKSLCAIGSWCDICQGCCEVWFRIF